MLRLHSRPRVRDPRPRVGFLPVRPCPRILAPPRAGLGSGERFMEGLALQVVDSSAARARRVFDELVRGALPPVSATDAPRAVTALLGLPSEHLDRLLDGQGRPLGASPTVLRLRVGQALGRGFARQLAAQPEEARERYLRETLPAIWWLDCHYGYTPFEDIHDHLDRATADVLWRTMVWVLVEMAHRVEPPRRERCPEDFLRGVRSTPGVGLDGESDEWSLLTRGLYRAISQPVSRRPVLAALFEHCRSPRVLSYVTSLDPVRNDAALLAELIVDGSDRAAMMALAAYLRADATMGVRSKTRDSLRVNAGRLTMTRIASLYGWLELLGDPDLRLAETLMELGATRLQMASQPDSPRGALTLRSATAFRPERLYSALALRGGERLRQRAAAEVLERLARRFRGEAAVDGPMDSRWSSWMTRATRDVCAPEGRTEARVVPLVMRAVHQASQALDREIPLGRVAVPVEATARLRAFVELLIYFARRLPGDDLGRSLARTLLGTALGTIQRRPELVRGLEALIVLDHLEESEGPAPLIANAFALFAARPFLERWRATERGEVDLASPRGLRVAAVLPAAPTLPGPALGDPWGRFPGSAPPSLLARLMRWWRAGL